MRRCREMVLLSSRNVGSDRPAVLQLQKWDLAQFQVNLSEYSEVFISPTREILLLLSYQSKALLFPLNAGIPLSSHLENSDSRRFESLFNPPSTSDPDSAFSLESIYWTSKKHGFVSDAKSLAWAHCGDAYRQHENALFKELLLVLGNCGLIVHGFRYSDVQCGRSRTAYEGKTVRQGSWVEWGPSVATVAETCTEGHSIGSAESDEYVQGVNVTPKKWLKTFFTQVETVESKGDFIINFPTKDSFPTDAEIVSFELCTTNSVFLDFLSRAISTSLELENESLAGGIRSEMTGIDSDEAARKVSPLKCFKVFSSLTHHHIGIAMTVADSVSLDGLEGNVQNMSIIIVAVAAVYSWGIQWTCAVQLPDCYRSSGLNIEWSDFKFSDNLLVCLSNSGVIYFWNAISGHFVANLDVSWYVELKIEPYSVAMKANTFVGAHSKQENVDYHSGKRLFKKLLVSFSSSLLAVVDQYGVSYVICADDVISEKHYSFNKLIPHFQHCGLGVLSGWEVAGSEIGCQKILSDISNYQDLHISSEANLCAFHRDDVELGKLNKWHIQDKVSGNRSNLIGFTNQLRAPSSRMSFNPLRKIIVPKDGCTGERLICFSPFGVTQLVKTWATEHQAALKIVHTSLHLRHKVADDLCLNARFCSESFAGLDEEQVFSAEAVGCCFQGCLYLVSQDGLFVVLPSFPVSGMSPLESIGYLQPCISMGQGVSLEKQFRFVEPRELCEPWMHEILERVLLFEDPKEADNLCLINGWELTDARMCRLQLALHYLKMEEIQQSLDMLVDVNLAVEGLLEVLFVAVYQLCSKVGSDNGVALASKLLALAACFATKMVRHYGLLEHKNNKVLFSGKNASFFRLESLLPSRRFEMSNLRQLQEISHFLEIIRNLQCRLSSKFSKHGLGLVDDKKSLALVDHSILPETFASATLDSVPNGLESQSHGELPLAKPNVFQANNLALPLMELIPSDQMDSLIVPKQIIPHEHQGGELQKKKSFPLENPKDMIARWKMGNLDLKTVVKDALQSDRLPLAVLQLHLHHLRNIDPQKEPHDHFSEIRDVGRSIAYDLLLKGETGLAVAALQRLGEDIEVTLHELVFGTVRRSLRKQLEEEMNRCRYLRSHEQDTLDRISLIERLYPSSSFWGTFFSRQTLSKESFSGLNRPIENSLQFHCSQAVNAITIECGDIDGVVIGSWTKVDGTIYHPGGDEESDCCVGYWAAAAVWSDAWDQRTIHRVLLGQTFVMGVHVLWESQLEYYICHNDWEEACKLLDIIPTIVLSEGSLQISLESLCHKRTVETPDGFSDHVDYFCSDGEMDAVCLHIPNVKIFTLSVSNMCSLWLRALIEEKLAKAFIFTKEYWEGTEEMVPLLARSGFIMNASEMSCYPESAKSSSNLDFLNYKEEYHQDTLQALHRVMVNHCSKYNLPSLLDLYVDHFQLVSDNSALEPLLDAAGECHWANWLLFSKIKGREYEASFFNARAAITRNALSGRKIVIPYIDDIIHTVDDIAEGGGEIAALATLVYAPVPIQKCLFSGSVNRRHSSSAQCTLENLRPALQNFPTLWRALMSCLRDKNANASHFSTNMSGKSVFTDYLNWREAIFLSAEGDTSLLQLLPFWFSKTVRKLIQSFVQGPLGWNSLLDSSYSRDIFVHRGTYHESPGNESNEVSSMSWEAAIQKNIKELYASSLKDTNLGVEHHLHRGRALGAFKQLLGARTQKLKLAYARKAPSRALAHGQTNIQADMQILLAPLTQDEESLLSSVIPLAVLHFEDPVLAASCASFLELCGVSAGMLRVDISALQRISSFHKSSNTEDYNNSVLPADVHPLANDIDIAFNLARVLADDYRNAYNLQRDKKMSSGLMEVTQRPSLAVITILQQLEKASLPLFPEGKTCGSWLLNGSGNGREYRSQQKASSRQWSLVTAFCQIHNLPPSTKYLSVLANDNDWVGFLTEAQFAGFPFDVVIDVAYKEFSDPRLRIHILNVLRGMQLAKMKGGPTSDSSSSRRNIEVSVFDENSMSGPVELFAVLADCEKQKNPGMLLLVRARELRWSLLAVVASCFPDVSSLACLTVWLEITASRETSSIKVNDIFSQIGNNVGAAVKATNEQPTSSRQVIFHYSRKNPKRRRLMEQTILNAGGPTSSDVSATTASLSIYNLQGMLVEDRGKRAEEQIRLINDPVEGLVSFAKMVVVLCEHHLFIPLLRAFEMFLPSCSLLSFIRCLQAFSQMRLTDASNHLTHFSGSIKDEKSQMPSNLTRESQIGAGWISSTAVKAAEVMLTTCPSPYEKRCLLHLLSSADFGDGGVAASSFRRLYWKINIAEPSLRKDEGLYLGNNDALDDASLLTALENNGDWELARSWARQLEASGAPWTNAFHHVTETQAEAMVVEWKEFLWDVPEERSAVWGHCQTLFIRHSFPALQAGLFFLRHAEAIEKDIPARELHEILLYSLQWLSGLINQCNPVYPLHLLREIETRVWLLAVEAEAQLKTEGDFTIPNHAASLVGENCANIIDQTATIIARMDGHLNSIKARAMERVDTRENNGTHFRSIDGNFPLTIGFGHTKAKRRAKGYVPSRRPILDTEKTIELDDANSSYSIFRNDMLFSRDTEDNVKFEASISGWEERLGPAELERAVLSLLEFGQVAAAKQLHHKLCSSHVPSELALVDAALKYASTLSPSSSREISVPDLEPEVFTCIKSHGIICVDFSDPMQVLEAATAKCTDGRGRGLCKRIISVIKAARVLGLSFSEAFGKKPVELLQLLCLKAQDSFEEAKHLVQTHFMTPASIAQILAESFLKGLLAAHRGGYMDCQKEEGPAPLLWRISDFLKWAELCPSESEIGHALMRLVITGQEIPHACEVELLILSHHFYKSSACLDGVDVLVALAATRVESYVYEGDFSCLARLVTGVSNFHALNFILGILIENGQLELLLHKYSAAEAAASSGDAVRGFRMAVLASLQHFNSYDLDAFAMVYNHFDMKHETASLLESRAMNAIQRWFHCFDRDQNEDLLESMRFYIEAAEVLSTIDAGNKTQRACAQASLLSLQIRMPDFDWLNLSETNARRALVEQSRFQEALIVAEAYRLNQPGEWAPVLWNQMLKPELTEQFVAEFVAVLPLHPSMLVELARFYRSEMAARGDQSHFSVWLSPGGLPAEWAKHLGRSFRSLLRRTRDLRLRAQLATIATGFGDVIDACWKILDRVPETAGPLVLRRGHGGGYLPLV